jgi:hypothetical protein
MSETDFPRFPALVGYLTLFLVSAAMIWYLNLSIFAPCLPCTDKTLEYFLLVPFCLVIAYSMLMLSRMLFPQERDHA